MRGLTVRQPWAWAIIHAGKDIENRSWTAGAAAAELEATVRRLARRGRVLPPERGQVFAAEMGRAAERATLQRSAFCTKPSL